MLAQRTVGEKVFDVFNIVFMSIVLIIMVFPLLHVVSTSLSDGSEILKGGIFLYPRGLNFSGYQTVLKDPMLLKSYRNTIIYAVLHTVFTLVFTCMTAYPLSVPDYCLKRFTTIFLTITMFIGGGMIPTFLLIKELNMINTIWVMALPFCVGVYNVVLFRTFFQGIPSSLRDAAMIDGASEFRILFSIILPLSKAILATIALFTIVGKWNDWFNALIYLTDENRYPIQMILRRILYNTASMKDMDAATRALLRNNKMTPQNIQMAAIVITILPILCIYPFLQKYFAKGIFVGTIKG